MTTEFPACLEELQCECQEKYCSSYTFRCTKKVLKCEKCFDQICLLCFSHCEYCNLILCYNCNDHYDNNFCFKTWYRSIEKIIFRLLYKYNQVDLKNHILSFINKNSF